MTRNIIPLLVIGRPGSDCRVRGSPERRSVTRVTYLEDGSGGLLTRLSVWFEGATVMLLSFGGLEEERKKGEPTRLIRLDTGLPAVGTGQEVIPAQEVTVGPVWPRTYATDGYAPPPGPSSSPCNNLIAGVFFTSAIQLLAARMRN